MSVGFGFSTGDFLAALKLVGTVIDALRESSSSGKTYRDLVNELHQLESALLRVKRLEFDGSQNVEKVALRQAAAQCQTTIDEFLKKIRKYQPHLGHRGGSNNMRDAWYRIKWALCKKDDVEAFRAQLQGHTSSIETLAAKIQELSIQWMAKLAAINTTVTETVDLGKRLLTLSAAAIRMNFLVFKTVHDIQRIICQIPGQTQHQQPVYLLDAFGKDSPFHLEFVRSAEALVAILKVNFKPSGCGQRMIERGEFVITDNGTHEDINLSRSWDSCFFPGQRVSMSMVITRKSSSISSASLECCPSCNFESGGDSQVGVTCSRCGTHFSTADDDLAGMAPPLLPTFQDARVKSALSTLEQLPKSLKRKRESDDATPDARQFRRLRVSKAKRGMRCMHYKLIADNWIDCAIGFASLRYVAKDLWLEVESEDETGRLILISKINCSSKYFKEQDTVIVWVDEGGEALALSFESRQGCTLISRKIGAVPCVPGTVAAVAFQISTAKGTTINAEDKRAPTLHEIGRTAKCQLGKREVIDEVTPIDDGAQEQAKYDARAMRAPRKSRAKCQMRERKDDDPWAAVEAWAAPYSIPSYMRRT
ncbi:hypothetical protein NA57DRAFT_73922 [Rhizodiscina lignyota]|uniref:Fungal N-terminal domain-containing protein n=1 Tax=Rhizodiscina lignyota TaxID=1504668 RepID=A0A9P4IIM1_9PEZI|nr:hypothetical protein NA57DRAFT_73922 [Rhizodiscina lignyota]